ncbi:MAG: TPM domain-containing protein [Pseudomonadales bacterium]
MADVKRIVRHLLMTHWQVRRAFPQETLRAIEHAIAASESTHFGQIFFAVEGALSGMSLLKGVLARERAVEVFSQLRVWDTEHNNGVLIYLLLADRSVEIVADRGIHAKVESRKWDAVCREMEAAFRRAEYQCGVIAGIQAISEHLGRHFPSQASGKNELSDRPVIL